MESVPRLPMKGGGNSLSLKSSRTNTGRINKFSSSTAKPLQSAALSHIRTVTKADFTPDLQATGFSRPDMRAGRDSTWKKDQKVASLEYSTLHGGWHEPPKRKKRAPKASLFAPSNELLRGTDRTTDSWASDIDRMRKQEARREEIKKSHGATHKEVPEYLKNLVDIDGDGQIDPEEMALMHELEHVEVRDVDGDGKISAEEIMIARKMAGKKILAERFIERQKGKLNRFSQELSTNTALGPESEAVKVIQNHKAFGTLYNALKIREAKNRLSSSDLMTGCLNWNGNRPQPNEDLEIRKYL